jgi:hypothetical protein
LLCSWSWKMPDFDLRVVEERPVHISNVSM